MCRYVFDQESPSKGVPHHTITIEPLQQRAAHGPRLHLPPRGPASYPTASPHLASRPSTPKMSFGSDTDSGVDFGFGFERGGRRRTRRLGRVRR